MKMFLLSTIVNFAVQSYLYPLIAVSGNVSLNMFVAHLYNNGLY